VKGSLNLYTVLSVPKGFKLYGALGYSKGKLSNSTSLLSIQPVKAVLGFDYEDPNGKWGIFSRLTYLGSKKAKDAKTLEIKHQEVSFNKPSEKTMEFINSYLTTEKLNAMAGNTKTPFNELYNLYEKDILTLAKEQLNEENEADFTESKLKMGVFNAIKAFIRSRTIETGKRIDDRGILDIRPLYCETDNLPRVHGSGLFWRGDTQVLSTVTLGGPTDYLVLDDMEHNDVQQRYFHHYNFPPFSTGEAKAMRGTGRREIGHGRLAEKALEFMIPSKETFPYSIRVVSECLGSGGSTSMGSVCGSTLALMDA